MLILEPIPLAPSIWFLGEAHAKTYQLQGSKEEYMESDRLSGLSNSEYSKNPEQLSLFGKTCEEQLATDLEKYSGALPLAGTMRNGKLYRQKVLERPTCAKGFFSLPTPQAYSHQSRQPGQTKLDGKLRQLLPTPTASDATMGAIEGKTTEIRYTKNGTPRAYRQTGSNGSVGLTRYLALLPTPTTRDRGTSPSQLNRNEPGLSVLLSLAEEEVLNPAFVEWMMGFPAGWID